MTRNAYDLLLEWASERGWGRWGHFRDAFEWLRPAVGRPGWESAGFAARQLSALGHIEIDWQGGTWAAAPPVLTLLPDAGAHALLTGGRTRELLGRLHAELDERHDLYGVDPHLQEVAPSTLLVASGSADSIQSLADALEVRYVHSVSADLARLLPGLDSYLALARAAPPGKGYGIKRMDLDALWWEDVEDDFEPGLYRYAAPEGPKFRLIEDRDNVFAVDLAFGVYAALSRWGANRIRYFPASVNGELEVPLRAPLPTLHSRAAALCSGLAPDQRGKCLVYVNVPRDIAEAIAWSLDQSLAIVEVG